MELDASFIRMPGEDLYFICQMIDRSLKDGLAYARHIDSFMGDAACGVLLQNYPKYTPLHQYIEYVVESVIWEDTKHDLQDVINEYNPPWRSKIWVDHLLDAHAFDMSLVKWHKNNKEKNDIEDYLQYLQEQGLLENLLDVVSKEVFHVLFSNRKILQNFSEHAAFQILETAPSFYPDKLTAKGYLKRASIPQWAKNAIFHRDKGICSNCKVNLTHLINLQEKLHFDHRIPLAKGGMNDVTNLQLLCGNCNLQKSSKNQNASLEYESWYKY